MAMESRTEWGSMVLAINESLATLQRACTHLVAHVADIEADKAQQLVEIATLRSSVDRLERELKAERDRPHHPPVHAADPAHAQPVRADNAPVQQEWRASHRPQPRAVEAPKAKPSESAASAL